MKQNLNKMSAPSAKLVRLGDGAYITVVMNGESLTLRKSESEANFTVAIEALKTENWDALYQAMRPVKAYVAKVQGVEVRDNAVYWNGSIMHNVLSDRILEFALQGLDHKPLCMFLNKLMANSSSRAVEELYKFLEHKHLPITENGNFLAYKGVRNDWYSITAGATKLTKGNVDSAGRIYNGIGEEIECLRNAVDDDKDRGCSYGLHAGSVEYAVNFARSGRVVIVEINPKDVVSIPIDCSYQKLRTCAYKVVGNYEAPLTDSLSESGWITDEDEDYYDDHDAHDNGHGYDCCDDYDCSCGDHDLCDCNVDLINRDDWDAMAEVDIAFDCPKSTWISYVEWYDNDELHITKTDGTTLVYEEVPREIAEDFANFVDSNGSAGVFYNRKIKNQYSSYEK
jgi:hypothetical protein